jgi:hypothetical protein
MKFFRAIAIDVYIASHVEVVLPGVETASVATEPPIRPKATRKNTIGAFFVQPPWRVSSGS